MCQCQICSHEIEENELEVFTEQGEMFWACVDCVDYLNSRKTQIVRKDNREVVWESNFKEFEESFPNGLDEDNRKVYTVLIS